MIPTPSVTVSIVLHFEKKILDNKYRFESQDFVLLASINHFTTREMYFYLHKSLIAKHVKK